MTIYKIYKPFMDDPYFLMIEILRSNIYDNSSRFLKESEVAQIHASYPDMLKDNFLKAIILTDIAMVELGLKF